MLDDLVLKLKARRNALGWTQRCLADHVGTTQSAISEVETGACGPSLRTFQRWADALGLDIALIERAEHEPA